MEKANKQFFRAIKVICEKDMKIYYTKPPVLIFGFIFPVFLFFNFSISILPLLLGMVTGTFCFSSLGVLLASPSTTAPSNVMMLSSLVRFPLIFISGIFVPSEELKGVGSVISYFSPITYLVDILKFSFRQKNSNPLILNLVILFGFTGIFLFLAHKFHKRNLMRGL